MVGAGQGGAGEGDQAGWVRDRFDLLSAQGGRACHTTSSTAAAVLRLFFAVLLLQGLWRPQGRARPPQQARPLSSSSPAHPVKQSQCSTKQVQEESSGAGEPANNTIAPHKPSRHLKNCVSFE